MRRAVVDSPPARPGPFATWFRTVGTMMFGTLIVVPLLIAVVAGPPLLVAYLAFSLFGLTSVAETVVTVLVTIIWLSTLAYWTLPRS